MLLRPKNLGFEIRVAASDGLTPEAFQRLAHRAAQAGATHVALNPLPPSRWQLEGSPDLYPSWSMITASLFKLYVPSALAEFLPAESARHNVDILEERCGVLRKMGLKAVLTLFELQWLPEPVYEAHPAWRGPQCELPVIARRPYWAPCADNPEVLALYREAAREVCRRVPEIDTIHVVINDSGAGLCWSRGLYPGTNGPAVCRGRAMAERVVGFLSTIQNGARDAGREVTIHMENLPPEEAKGVLSSLQPGQAVCNVRWDGQKLSAAAGMFWFTSYTYPVLGIVQPFRFLEELEAARDSGALGLTVWTEQMSLDFHFDLLEMFQHVPCVGLVGRAKLLERFAAERYGVEMATGIVEVWRHVEEAITHIRMCAGKGYDAIILMIGAALERFLIRPLVPSPLDLDAHERDYYERYQFTADPPPIASNFQWLHGRHTVMGLTFSAILARAEQSVNAARQRLRALICARDGETTRELALLETRLHLLRHLLRNAGNCMKYQYALDCAQPDYVTSAAPEGQHPGITDPALRALRYRLAVSAEHRQLLRDSARDEIDNTLGIIEILDAAPHPELLLALASSEQEEDVFTFSPRLKDQLRKKISVMLSRWPQYNHIYPSLR